jgi:hypothetical protein
LAGAWTFPHGSRIPASPVPLRPGVVFEEPTLSEVDLLLEILSYSGLCARVQIGAFWYFLGMVLFICLEAMLVCFSPASAFVLFSDYSEVFL